jgi:Tfp pilus assembly protein PilF
MHHRALRPAALVAALLAAQGCATAPRKLAFTPDELRDQLARRIPRDEVVIPFEISAEHARRAQSLTTGSPDPADKVRILVDALLDPRAFGLRYLAGVPGTAEDAFRNGGGDCLALASAFVGMARAAGLEASYMDASFRMQETEVLSEQTVVKIGHITAFVLTPSDRIGLDFARLGRIYWYEPIDDVEAVAHFHNNLGYVLLERGGTGGTPAGWAAALHQFELATRVRPGFARAWNNMGVAQARLGRRTEARAAYRRAIAADGGLASPRLNLGALLLEAGELEEAAEHLEAAARLDPDSPNVQYELGLVRLERGDRHGAVKALERAVAAPGGWPAAKALLDRLAGRQEG